MKTKHAVSLRFVMRHAILQRNPSFFSVFPFFQLSRRLNRQLFALWIVYIKSTYYFQKLDPDPTWTVQPGW